MVEGEVPDSESEASRLFGAISAVIRPDRHGAGGQKISGEVVADGDGLLAGGRLLSPSQDLLDAVEGMDDEAESAAVAGARSECASKAAESLKPGN